MCAEADSANGLRTAEVAIGHSEHRNAAVAETQGKGNPFVGRLEWAPTLELAPN